MALRSLFLVRKGYRLVQMSAPLKFRTSRSRLGFGRGTGTHGPSLSWLDSDSVKRGSTSTSIVRNVETVMEQVQEERESPAGKDKTQEESNI